MTSCSPPSRARVQATCGGTWLCGCAGEGNEGARLTVFDRHVARCSFQSSPSVATAEFGVNVNVRCWGSGTRRCRTGQSPRRGHLRGFEVGDSFKPSLIHCTMSSPLADVWEAAAASPFQPTIGKNSQFTIGFALLFACRLSSTRAVRSRANNAPALLLTGFFGLSMPSTSPQLTTALHVHRSHSHRPLVHQPAPCRCSCFDSIWVCTPHPPNIVMLTASGSAQCT